MSIGTTITNSPVQADVCFDEARLGRVPEGNQWVATLYALGNSDGDLLESWPYPRWKAEELLTALRSPKIEARPGPGTEAQHD